MHQAEDGAVSCFLFVTKSRNSAVGCQSRPSCFLSLHCKLQKDKIREASQLVYADAIA